MRGRFAVEQLEVAAHALFIPAFFLTTGFLVDFGIVKKTIVSHPGLVLALVGASLGGTWLAARLTGLFFGCARAEALTKSSREPHPLPPLPAGQIGTSRIIRPAPAPQVPTEDRIKSALRAAATEIEKG